VGWIVHRVPFHRSARVVPEFEAPTAVQAEGAEQETARNPPPVAGLGDGTMRHFTPFHRSASVATGFPALSVRAPTAMQVDGPVQATPPSRVAPWAPGGFGVGWMRHAVPFQRSASVVPIPELSKETPVVVQAEGEVQDTGPMKTACAPAGAGMGRILQAVPFHRSASGLGCPGPPMAMQNDPVRHDTPPKTLPCAPEGVGVGWTRQAVPFHRSARGTEMPARLVVWPTAVHDEGDVHETMDNIPGGSVGVGRMLHRVPFHRSARNPPMLVGLWVPPTAMHDLGEVQSTLNRALAAAPARLGVDWMPHLVPFQCSPRVTGVLRLLIELPTAVQAEADLHDTASRKPPCAPAGLGVAWMRQRVPIHRSAKVTSVPELFP